MPHRLDILLVNQLSCIVQVKFFVYFVRVISCFRVRNEEDTLYSSFGRLRLNSESIVHGGYLCSYFYWIGHFLCQSVGTSCIFPSSAAKSHVN